MAFPYVHDIASNVWRNKQMYFMQHVVAVSVANSKSSWIFRSWSAIYDEIPMSCYCCISLIHERKWRIGHWQDFVNETASFVCVLLLYVCVTVKFWQEQTFTWFPILSKYSLPFGLLIAFVIRFCFLVFALIIVLEFCHLLYPSVQIQQFLQL